MKFPVELKHTFHRHGGRIVKITGIEHTVSTPKWGRSQDTWFYRGDVEWNDGTTSKGIEIAPYAPCHDDDPRSRQEVLDLSEALSDYLHDRGAWCDDSTKHAGWYCHERGTKKRRAA